MDPFISQGDQPVRLQAAGLQPAPQPVQQPQAPVQPKQALQVPQSLLDKYHSGQLNPQIAMKLEEAQKAGKIQLGAPPQATRIGDTSVVDASQVDRERGGGFLTRAVAGLKSSEKGKINYLKQKFGDENVAQDTKGNIVFREGSDLGWRSFDEKGFDFGDIADFSGDAIEGTAGAAGAVGLGLVTGGAGAVAGGVAGGAAGNAARQGLSKLIAGDDEMDFGDRASQALVSGAIGGVAGGAGVVGKKAFTGIKNLNDKRKHGRAAVEGARMIQQELSGGIERSAKAAADGIPEMSENFAEKALKEGRILEKEVGPLSAAQLAKSQPGLRKEALARNNEATSQQVRDFDRFQLKVAQKRLDKVMDSIGPKESALSAGTKVKQAYEGVVSGHIRKRQMQAKKDFAEVDSAAGRARIFRKEDMSNLETTIADIMESSLPPTSRIQNDKSFKAAQGLLENLDEGWSASDMQNALSFFSKASAGTGRLFPDMDAGFNRMVASRMQRALEKDLDTLVDKVATGKSPTRTGLALESLKTARDNYRQNSIAIEKIRNTALGKVTQNKDIGAVVNALGEEGIEGGDKVAAALGKLSPGELSMTRSILEKHDPVALQSLQRIRLQQIIDKAPAAATSGDSEVADISAAQFFNHFRKNREELQAILPKEQYRDTMMVAKYLQRVSDRGATGESPTGNYLMQMINSVLPAGAVNAAVNTVRGMSAGQTNKVTAEMMTNPTTRDAMLTLARSKDGKGPKVAQAATYLASAAAIYATGLRDDTGVRD